jgi:hypothetical protein
MSKVWGSAVMVTPMLPDVRVVPDSVLLMEASNSGWPAGNRAK